MTAIGGRKVKVEITPVEAGTGKEFHGYLTNARFSAADSDSDTLTFADAAADAKDYFFQGTALQDDGGDADSFFAFVEANLGDKVTVVVMPQGNDTPTTAAPHRSAVVTVTDFDGDFFGGEANASTTARQTFDFSWKCDARPAAVTA